MWYLLLIFNITTGISGEMGGIGQPPGPFSSKAACDVAGNAAVAQIMTAGSTFKNHALADHVCIQIQ